MYYNDQVVHDLDRNRPVRLKGSKSRYMTYYFPKPGDGPDLDRTTAYVYRDGSIALPGSVKAAKLMLQEGAIAPMPRNRKVEGT